jgi:hypothetical protein
VKRSGTERNGYFNGEMRYSFAVERNIVMRRNDIILNEIFPIKIMRQCEIMASMKVILFISYEIEYGMKISK